MVTYVLTAIEHLTRLSFLEYSKTFILRTEKEFACYPLILNKWEFCFILRMHSHLGKGEVMRMQMDFFEYFLLNRFGNNYRKNP